MTLPNFRFTTDHASPRTSCLAPASCLSHLSNKQNFLLAVCWAEIKQMMMIVLISTCNRPASSNDELGHGIYISDIHTVVQFICQGRMSREKYRGKPCLIATVAQFISINGTVIVSIQPGCRIRWQSTLRAEIYQREVHMHNCVGRKCLGAKWSQLTSHQAHDFAIIYWSQVAVGLEDVAATAHAGHQEWRNPACNPGNCCLMMHSAMWFRMLRLPCLDQMQIYSVSQLVSQVEGKDAAIFNNVLLRTTHGPASKSRAAVHSHEWPR